MYKVLFADDEPIALSGIAMLTDWESSGFEICGLCSNGEEALAAVESCRPDLIITDIRMPGLDGLELIGRIKQELEPEYDPVFIIMSGYSDFQYARSALRCGVKHYLLKPVLDTDWDPVFVDIQKELQAKQMEREGGSRLLKCALNRLLRGDAPEPDEEAAWLMAHLDRKSAEWRYIHIDGESEQAAAAISRMKLSYPRAIVLNGGHGQAGLAVDDSLDAMEIARSLCRELLRAGTQPRVSVGPPVPSLRELPVSYSGAVEEAAYHFFHAKQEPVEHENGKRSSLSYSLKAMKMVELLLASAEKLQAEETGALVSRLFQLFREELTAPEVVQTLCAHIVLRTTEVLRELKAGAESRIESRHILPAAPKCMPGLEQSLRSYMAEYMERLRSHKESVSSHPLQAVKRYVSDNYKKPLTIKEIGARFYMNPVYLGNAFSNKFGIGIIEYIHDLRIQEAKRLLRDSDQTVCSIAEEVGYVHYNHFLMEFRKREPEKPNVYRQQARDRNEGRHEHA